MTIITSGNCKLTTNEVAAILNVGNNTVRKWSNVGLLKVERIGPRRDRLFKLEDIEKYLNERKESG